MSPQNQTMIEICDELTKDGKELIITWDGGNDEGNFYTQLDGIVFINENYDLDPIEEYVCNHLGYGSFAGDFSTNGELKYNRETKCFEGRDNYSTSETENYKCRLKVSVPLDIWFDQLHINIEMENEDKPEVVSTFIIANGPRIDRHTEIENRIDTHLKRQVIRMSNNMDDFISLFEDLRISKRDFREHENKLVFFIKNLSYSYDYTKDNDVQIYLPEQ
jgi:hypothetical protein